MSQMLHSLTCGSANKGDYLLFQMSTINAAISFITHFPTHPFKCSLLKGNACWLLRPGQVNGIFFEAKIPAWWQHLEKLSIRDATLGSNTANQDEKRRREKKKKAIPSPSTMGILWVKCPENLHSGPPTETKLFVNTRLCYLFATLIAN